MHRGSSPAIPDAAVERVLLAVDAVAATVDEAIELDADLLIAHHPLLLRGVTSIAEDRYKGALLARLIRARLRARRRAHERRRRRARHLGRPRRAAGPRRRRARSCPAPTPRSASAASAASPEPTTLGRLARLLADLLPPTATGVRVAGGYDDPVETVALCGGAGDSLLADPAVRAADVYITADLRHHPASEAREQALVGGGPALIDVSHWASEWLWLDAAAAELRAAHPDLDVRVSELRTDPWDFQVVQ